MLPRFRAMLASPTAPMAAHYGTLAAGALVMIAATSRLWLFFDDWSFIVDVPGTIWAAHVGHWSTIPWAVFVAIRNVFGVDSVLPYAIPVIAVHLTLVHLLWRLMLRIGVLPWIATATSFLLTFYGAGGENILWPFQVGFIGAMTAMIGALLLLMRDGREVSPPRAIGAALLATVAVATSGTALPLLVVVALVSVVRHGILRTAAILAAPVIAYGTWYLIVGRHWSDRGRAGSPSELLEVPLFGVRMLSDGIAKTFPVEAFGTLVVVALLLWWAFRIGSERGATRDALLLVLAAPLFALLTGFSRVGLGLQTATSGRYVYFVFFVIAPFAALALTRLLARTRLSVAVASLLIVVVGLYNVGALIDVLGVRAQRTAATRATLSAAADLLREHPGRFEGGARPYSLWSVDVRMEDLRSWMRRGWFHPAAHTRSDTLSVLATIDVASARATAPETRLGCDHALDGEGTRGPDDGSVLVYAENSTSISLFAIDGDVRGEGESRRVPAGWTRYSLIHEPDLALGVIATGAPVTVCPA